MWQKRLENQKLIKVTGWRSCIMDNQCSQRMRVTFMIRLFSLFNRPQYLSGSTGAYIDTFTVRGANPNNTSTSGIL